MTLHKHSLVARIASDSWNSGAEVWGTDWDLNIMPPASKCTCGYMLIKWTYLYALKVGLRRTKCKNIFAQEKLRAKSWTALHAPTRQKPLPNHQWLQCLSDMNPRPETFDQFWHVQHPLPRSVEGTECPGPSAIEIFWHKQMPWTILPVFLLSTGVELPILRIHNLYGRKAHEGTWRHYKTHIFSSGAGLAWNLERDPQPAIQSSSPDLSGLQRCLKAAPVQVPQLPRRPWVQRVQPRHGGCTAANRAPRARPRLRWQDLRRTARGPRELTPQCLSKLCIYIIIYIYIYMCVCVVCSVLEFIVTYSDSNVL